MHFMDEIMHLFYVRCGYMYVYEKHMHMNIYIYIHTHSCIYIYIYIYTLAVRTRPTCKSQSSVNWWRSPRAGCLHILIYTFCTEAMVDIVVNQHIYTHVAGGLS